MREDHVTGQAHLTVALPGCVLYPWRGSATLQAEVMVVKGVPSLRCMGQPAFPAF